MFRTIREDIQSVLDRDPAASSRLVVLLYPGLHAVWVHHLNHFLWRRGFKLLARYLSQLARFWTGIEIHPGATIGRRLFIDHGMGVVIGETAVVGDDVSILHNVTLGGTGKESGDRHPKIGRGVLLATGAKVLGNVTIGEGAKIGAGSVVLRAVAPYTTVAGVPARVVGRTHDLPGRTMDQDFLDFQI